MGRLEEILIVVLVILLLFGSKKIPELARNLGKSVREVKKGFSDSDNTTESKVEESRSEEN